MSGNCSRVVMALVAVAALNVAGCGGGGGGGGGTALPVAVSDAPKISNLTILPNQVAYVQNGGTLPAAIAFDSTDSKNDITTAYITTFYSNGTLYNSWNGAIACNNGKAVTTGNVITNIKDTFTVKVTVSDSQANASNQLSGQVTIQ